MDLSKNSLESCSSPFASLRSELPNHAVPVSQWLIQRLTCISSPVFSLKLQSGFCSHLLGFSGWPGCRWWYTECAPESHGAPRKHRPWTPGPEILCYEEGPVSLHFSQVPGDGSRTTVWVAQTEPACSFFFLVCFWPKSLTSGATSTTCPPTPALPHLP